MFGIVRIIMHMFILVLTFMSTPHGMNMPLVNLMIIIEEKPSVLLSHLEADLIELEQALSVSNFTSQSWRLKIFEFVSTD